MSFPEFDEENFDEENKRIVEFIDFLCELKNPDELLVNDPKTHDVIFYLHRITSIEDFNDLIDWSPFLDKKCYDLFGGFVGILYEKLKISIDGNQKQTFLNLIKLLNSIFTKSALFCLHFNHSIGLDSFIKILKDIDLIEKLLKTNIREFLIFLVANLNLLSRYSEDTLHKWKRLDTANTLLNILKFEPRLKRSIYQAIINVAHDEDDQMIDNIGSSINIFKQMLDQACIDLKMDALNREFKEFLDDYSNVKRLKVHIIQIQYGQMALSAVLYVFYRLILLNDTIKKNIYFDLKLKDYLKIILSKGNLIERKFALKLVAQFLFDNESIRQDIANDKELAALITNIISNLNSDPCYNIDDTFFMKITKQAEIIKFYLLNENQDQSTRETKSITSTKKSTQHIMMSFHKTNLKICYKIKSKLESKGFKVWMDIDDSTIFDKINLVHEAIENSFCVLICVNEKYRQSISCRDEAKYALMQKKKILPLIMQEGYQSSKGWLNAILENNVYFDFCQIDLNISLKKLENYLKEMMHGKVKFTIENEIKTNKNRSEREKILDKAKIIENWSEDQVKEWFKKASLNTDIIGYLAPLNGEILRQLYEIRCEAPHFFNKSLKRIGQFNKISLGSFSFQLHKLFTN